MVSSLRKSSSSRQNKSVESLRSKSWAQYLENSSSPLAGSRDMMLPRAQASLFGQQRRFSYGWPPNSNASTTATSTSTVPASPSIMENSTYDYFVNDKSRLTTSQSYSDIHAAARSYTTSNNNNNSSRSIAPYDTSPDLSKENSILCPQYQQYGICTMEDQCPYSHSPHTATSTAIFSPHPLAAGNTTNANLYLHPQSSSTSSIHQLHQHPLQHPLLGTFPSSSSLNHHHHHHQQSSPFPFDPSSNSNNGTSFFPTGKMLPRHSIATSGIHGQPSTFNNELANINNKNEMMMHSSFHSSPSLDFSSGNGRTSPSPGSSTLPPQHRRSIADPEANRFLGAKLEDFHGKLYDLCKDHNGCRFLQKKLEDPNGQHLQTIFDEIHPHFVELMTGKKKISSSSFIYPS